MITVYFFRTGRRGGHRRILQQQQYGLQQSKIHKKNKLKTKTKMRLFLYTNVLFNNKAKKQKNKN